MIEKTPEKSGVLARHRGSLRTTDAVSVFGFYSSADTVLEFILMSSDSRFARICEPKRSSPTYGTNKKGHGNYCGVLFRWRAIGGSNL